MMVKDNVISWLKAKKRASKSPASSQKKDTRGPSEEVAKAKEKGVQELSKRAEGMHSYSLARADQFRRSPRVQLSFSSVPEAIKAEFDAEAEARGMTKKEFLYHCMRAAGLDIPPQEEIDRRRI